MTIYSYINRYYNIIFLTAVEVVYIIMMAHMENFERIHDHDLNKRHSRQGQGTAKTQFFKPTPGKRDGRALCRVRLLRPPGPSTGQIRDAATCEKRWMVGRPSSKSIWVFTECIVSSPRSLQKERDRRPDARTPRPETASQVYRRSDGLYRRSAIEGWRTHNRAVMSNDKGTLWNFGASPERRTFFNALPKKGQKTSAELMVLDLDMVTHRYEQLRSHVLGESFSRDLGLGLALFMRSGMAAWAEAWAEYIPKVKDEVDIQPTVRIAIPENIVSQITMLIANMVFNVQRGD
jgi:hypothetical protein